MMQNKLTLTLASDGFLTKIKRMIRLALSEDQIIAALSNIQDIESCLDNECGMSLVDVIVDIEHHAGIANKLLIGALGYGSESH